MWHMDDLNNATKLAEISAKIYLYLNFIGAWLTLQVEEDGEPSIFSYQIVNGFFYERYVI